MELFGMNGKARAIQMEVFLIAKSIFYLWYRITAL
jgi:hypothetical protein